MEQSVMLRVLLKAKKIFLNGVTGMFGKGIKRQIE
jgi:hypothetical protein